MKRLPAGPTADLLAVFVLVFLAQVALGLADIPLVLALAVPLLRPWSVVTSVYAHAGVWHLLTNAIALAIVGFALERSTTRLRFHVFVLATGALAGLAQWYATALLGDPVPVIGASGAILALYGYVVTGNPLTGGLLSVVRLGPRLKVVLLIAAALLVTVLTAGPGVALVSHFVGFALGVVSGRLGVLRTGDGGNASLK